MISKIRGARRHAMRAIAVSAVAPAVALGLCGSALADSFSTPMWTEYGQSIIYAGYGFIGYTSADGLKAINGFNTGSYTSSCSGGYGLGGVCRYWSVTAPTLTFSLQMSGTRTNPATETMEVFVQGSPGTTTLATYNNSSGSNAAPSTTTTETVIIPSTYQSQTVSIGLAMNSQSYTYNGNVFTLSNYSLAESTFCVPGSQSCP